MHCVLLHSKWMILELLRQPSYVVSTVSFPALFYVIFALPESTDKASSNLLMASFCCFAVFGVIFLQFGVGIAQERSRSWYYYLKTLPVKNSHLVAARFLSSLFFAALASLKIIFIGVFFAEVQLEFLEWFIFGNCLLLGGVSFCTMGLCLGYWSTERSSLPVGNLIYLPLSFAGGLWKPPAVLPELLKDISNYLPTRHYGEILWKVVRSEAIPMNSMMAMVGFFLLFGGVAVFGARRDFKARLV